MKFDKLGFADLPPVPEQLKILVAEDNLINQKVFSYMLNRLQLSADFAGDGLDVMSAVLEHPYDIIFMDLHMPEMDGLATARAIRLLSIRQPYIVAMTASMCNDDQQNCVNAGMNEFITKPIKLSDLAALLQLFISGGK